MNAFVPFLVAGVVFGLGGYIIGAVQRERRYRRQASDNLALSNARADRNRLPVPVPVSDVDQHHGTGGTVHGETGRRAIPRPDVRARPGRYAARGGPRGADAQAMTSRVRPPRLEFDCDRG